jgi:5-methylcytosine-specific restriction endonuclease McrA
MYLVLMLLLSQAQPLPCQGAGQHRNQTEIEHFKSHNPCPKKCITYTFEKGKFVLYEKCGACQVDHICPLACCGLDKEQNMQWLTSRENRAKSADCTACK